MISRAICAALLLAFSGCALGDRTLRGTYKAQGYVGTLAAPDATLTLGKSHEYTLCKSGVCSSGRWILSGEGRTCDGRVTFEGRSVEDYILGFQALAYGVGESRGRRERIGTIDLSYSSCSLSTDIWLAAGDASFRKQ